jgi:5-formyltetrahydrofolate cyclo-ligase
MIASKFFLRILYKLKRKKISDLERTSMSLEIANKCLELDIWNEKVYHLFLPIENKNEIDTNFLLTLLQGRDKKIVIPKIFNLTLNHYLLSDQTNIRVNKIGIPEPEDGIKISTKTIDVVFVPLLVIDKNGNRVGYGKGFYDNFLNKCSKKTIKIGLSFFELIPKIVDIKTYDIKLDYAVTPKNIYDFRDL